MTQSVAITGISRGIGLELAKTYLKQGFTVHGTIRKPNDEVTNLMSGFPDKLHVHQVDVTKPEEVKALGEDIQNTNEAIDVVINNAGALSGYQTKLADLDPAELSSIFDINVNGPLRITQALLPALKKSSNPKLIHVSSKVGSIADNSSGGAYAYRISKTALNMLSKNISLEYPEITSAVMHPGWVQTEMGGEKAPVTPEMSAKGINKVISGLSSKDSGLFFDYEGKQIPW